MAWRSSANFFQHSREVFVALFTGPDAKECTNSLAILVGRLHADDWRAFLAWRRHFAKELRLPLAGVEAVSVDPQQLPGRPIDSPPQHQHFRSEKGRQIFHLLLRFQYSPHFRAAFEHEAKGPRAVSNH